MAQIISEDPRAYEKCPFCGYVLDMFFDRMEEDTYADDQVYVEWYRCSRCGAKAQVRYVFSDVTWTLED